MMEFDLPLGQGGVTLADLRLRLYVDAVPLAVIGGGGVSLSPTATGVDYALTGLPATPGCRYTATYEYPEGVGASLEWFGDGSRSPGVTPGTVVIPLREGGQAGALDLALFRDSEEAGSTLVVEEVGSPGDYAVSGWPLAAPGERWTLRWQIGGLYYQRSWRAPAPPATEDAAVPETVFRRLIATYFLEAWLGAGLDEKRFCPARCLGYSGEEASFSVKSVDDVAPWTPAEVMTTVGYVLLRLRELDRFDTGLTSGVGDAGGIVSQEYRVYALDFEFAVPSKLKGGDAATLVERRRAAVEALFGGFAMLPEGTPVLSLRNLDRYPTRRRAGLDDGTWKRSYLMVQIRARVRKIHAGTKEATLP